MIGDIDHNTLYKIKADLFFPFEQCQLEKGDQIY